MVSSSSSSSSSSSYPPEQKAAIIVGATGNLGRPIKTELEGHGFTVYGGSRTRGEFQYSAEQLTNSEYWYQKISEYAEGKSGILLVNTLGQAHTSPGRTLEDLNVRPVVALAEAGKRYALEHPEKKVTVVQVSAIAAKYLDDAYGQSRAAADRTVMELATENPVDNFKATVLQFPLIFTNPEESDEEGRYRVSTQIPWSAAEISGLPVVPLAGSGRQQLFPVSLHDAAHAVLKAYERNESAIVEARGSDMVTQQELIDLYANLRNRNITYIPLPPALLGKLLDTFPYGLLEGYAPRVMGRLPEVADPEQGTTFADLLGREPEGIRSQHEGLHAENVDLPSPPVRAHLATHAGKISAIATGTLAAFGMGLAYFLRSRGVEPPAE